MLNWPTKHVTSLTLSPKQTVKANGIVTIARIYRRTVNVYSFLSVGPTYRARPVATRGHSGAVPPKIFLCPPNDSNSKN